MSVALAQPAVSDLPVGMAVPPASASMPTSDAYPCNADFHWAEMGRSTREVAAGRLRSGLRPLTLGELRARGEALGYELRMVHTFTSTDQNGRPWEGVDAHWHERQTGIPVDTESASGSPNFHELQDLRTGSLVVARGRILRH